MDSHSSLKHLEKLSTHAILYLTDVDFKLDEVKHELQVTIVVSF